jgi:hypothetical protein
VTWAWIVYPACFVLTVVDLALRAVRWRPVRPVVLAGPGGSSGPGRSGGVQGADKMDRVVPSEKEYSLSKPAFAILALVAVVAVGCSSAKTAGVVPAQTASSSAAVASPAPASPSHVASSAASVPAECAKFAATMKGVGTAITTAESQEQADSFAQASKVTAAGTIAAEQTAVSADAKAEPIPAISAMEAKVSTDLAPITDPSAIGPGSISSVIAQLGTDTTAFIAAGGTCPQS